ncbi:MAG TPA: 6-phosphogluconolactonase [Polyangiaceae bacterium]|nr:6-phosphogluconolactonase [Polyangiaceae bacterium]
MTRLVVLADPDEVASRAALEIARLAGHAACDRGAFRLALSGGTTPRAAYERLARLGLDWSQIHAFFGDERAVPADDPDSNFRMAREALFDRVAIPSANVHRMRGEAEDLDAAARAYEAELPDALDLALLGMGEDGHTASLFPGSTAIDEAVRKVLPVVGPKPPPRRLTLTMPVLRAARERIVLVTGAGKASVLARVLTGPLALAELPVQVARDGLFLVDRAAAQALPRDWLEAHAT